MRHALTLLVALVLGAGAAAGAIAVGPGEAEAAGTKIKGCTGSKVSVTKAEKQMLALHNRARSQRDLPKLCIHPALQKAARAHSKDMIRRDYFSHDTKGKGESFAQRIRRHGYKYRVSGENIAWGSGSQGSPRQIFSKGRYNWMDSPGHRKNILDRRFREVGIAAHTGTYNGYRDATMWTADFGDR